MRAGRPRSASSAARKPRARIERDRRRRAGNDRSPPSRIGAHRARTKPQAQAFVHDTTPNPEYIRAVQERVHGAPYARLIGMRLASMEFDRCRIELDIRDDHLQPFGIVHGGVFATLIDTATFGCDLPRGTALATQFRAAPASIHPWPPAVGIGREPCWLAAQRRYAQAG